LKDASFDLRGLMLAIGAGSWLAGILLSSVLLLPALALLAVVGTLLICVLLFWHNRQARLTFCFALCLLLGAWRYAIALPDANLQAISRFAGVVQVHGIVCEEPKLQGRSRKIILQFDKISRDKGQSWENAHGKLSAQLRGALPEDLYGPNYSDEVQLQGKLQPSSIYDPPGTFASMAFPRVSIKSAAQNPLIAYLYHVRTALADSIARALPQPMAALLVAILLSLRTPGLRPLTSAFNATGTAHLIAPSGYKVTIFAGIISGIMGRLFPTLRNQQHLLSRQRRGGWQAWCTTMLIVMSIALYTLINGAGPAALRAGIMGILLSIAPRLGRVYNIFTAISLVALLMSIFDPFIIWDVGFQLSFLGTLGIVLLTPYFQRLFHAIEHIPGGRYVAETVSVTMAAQVATLPILVITFHEISLIAPLANILVMPLLSPMLLLGMLLCGSSFIFTPVAVLWGWIATPLLWYMITVVTWCANQPGAVIIVDTFSTVLAWGYYASLIVSGSFIWSKKTSTKTTEEHNAAQAPVHNPSLAILNKRTWRIIQISVALLILIVTEGSTLIAHAHGPLRITFLNVGTTSQPAHGEAALINTPDGKTVLVDGGPDIAALSQALDTRLPSWQRSLDAVILTTPRLDHITGLVDIVNRYTIGEVIDAGMLHPTTTYALWRRIIHERELHYVSVAQGVTIPIGSEVALQVLWPSSSLHKGSDEARDNALIMRLITKNGNVLFLGVGAQSKYALAGLADGVDANYLRASIVHIVGSDNTPFPDELEGILQEAQPSMLVITPAIVAAKHRLSPDQPTSTAPGIPISMLSSSSMWQTVQTTQEGSVEIIIDQNGYSINLV